MASQIHFLQLFFVRFEPIFIFVALFKTFGKRKDDTTIIISLTGFKKGEIPNKYINNKKSYNM